MGQIYSKKYDVSDEASSKFTRKELTMLRSEFVKIGHHSSAINKEQFTVILSQHVQDWTAGHMFLERLFDAFDANGDKTIDLNEFLDGLSVFVKGTAEEKMELSFRIYDFDHKGYVTQKEIARFLNQMYSTFYNVDQTQQINEMTKRLFEDLDVNGDGQLSLDEYKLSALKEPMVINFLEQFLVDKSEKM